MFDPRREQNGLPVPAGELGSQSLRIPVGYHPQHYAGYEPQPEPTFDPLKLLWYVVHYRWLIATLLLAGFVSGLLFTWSQTPLFRSSAKVEIVTSGAKVLEDLEVVSQVGDLRAFETARQKMLSRELAKRVVFELGLAEDDRFLAPTPRFSLTNFVDRVTGSSSKDRLADLEPQERADAAIEKILKSLAVELVRNTSILSVTYSHPDPEYAAKIANQVAASYIDQNVDKGSETSDLARQFIEQQVGETKEKLQENEKALLEYAKEANITITGNDASLIAANINELNKALTDAVQERLAAERFAKQVAEGNSATLPEVFESTSIGTIREKIAELKATYQEKLSTLKPGFPEMVRLQAQIRELERQIDAEISSIALSTQIRSDQAKEKVDAIQRELSGLEARQADFQEKNVQYTILKREVDSYRSQYESLIDKLNDVGVGAGLKTGNAVVVDPATIANAPYSPRLSRNLILALALFSMIAAATIYLLELLNNTFAVPDQIESDLKLPVLGIIPFMDGDTSDAFKESKSAVSEAYRTLRTSVQFAGAEGQVRTLLVTSSEPSEGKSTTAYKLAKDFAALGRKVLIIDADLRRPRLHRLFNTDNSIGLSNLLSNVVRQGDVLSIFRKTSELNVTFMAAGTIPPNPVDLLTSQKMAMTLHFCTKRFDLVIVDSPPVMGLSDAPILSRQMDATLLVVSSKQVSRSSAKNALSRIKAAGGNVVGAALTKFKAEALSYNHAYRYMGYNYYTYDNDQQKIEGPVAASDKNPYVKHSGSVGAMDRLRSLFRRAAA
jgi:succinoglycan biosynthesis transport protein ExoP